MIRYFVIFVCQSNWNFDYFILLQVKSLFFGKKIFKHKDHPPVGGDSPFGEHQETTKSTKED